MPAPPLPDGAEALVRRASTTRALRPDALRATTACPEET